MVVLGKHWMALAISKHYTSSEILRLSKSGSPHVIKDHQSGENVCQQPRNLYYHKSEVVILSVCGYRWYKYGHSFTLSPHHQISQVLPII